MCSAVYSWILDCFTLIQCWYIYASRVGHVPYARDTNITVHCLTLPYIAAHCLILPSFVCSYIPTLINCWDALTQCNRRNIHAVQCIAGFLKFYSATKKVLYSNPLTRLGCSPLSKLGFIRHSYISTLTNNI